MATHVEERKRWWRRTPKTLKPLALWGVIFGT